MREHIKGLPRLLVGGMLSAAVAAMVIGCADGKEKGESQ